MELDSITGRATSSLGRWSLRGIELFLSQLTRLEESMETLLTDETRQAALQRMRTFHPRSDLSTIFSLIDSGSVPEPNLAPLVLQRLGPFFDGGWWLERKIRDPEGLWWLAGFVTRGEEFILDPKERIATPQLVPSLSPEEVRRARSDKIVARVSVPMAKLPAEADALLFQPTPTTAYIWFSSVPALWREKHVLSTLSLINRAFCP